MPAPSVQIWDEEKAWREARYSPAYVHYLRLTLPPGGPGHLVAVRDADERLWTSPIVKVILDHQGADGSWPLGGPPWFRVAPLPLLVLLDYGMRDHEAARRGIGYLVSSIAAARFPWPRHDPGDPREFYIAYNARCLQVMERAGMAADRCVQGIAQNLLGRQRWDGGWSIKPAYLYAPGEPRPDPAPSCWICTLESMRALGRVLALSPAVIEGIIGFWRAQWNSADVGLAENHLVFTLPDVRLVSRLIACLEFCANQGLRVGNPDVDRFLSHLDTGRGPYGTVPGLSDYLDILTAHLTWRVRQASG